MKMSMKSVLVVAVAAIAAVVAFRFLHPSEEDRVKEAFKHAAETVSKEAEEPLFAMASKIRSIADLVDDEITLSVPEQNVDAKFTRNELAQQVMAARRACASLVVAFESVSVQSIEGDVAHASADLLVAGKGTMSFLQGRDAREVLATLRKSPEDGKWRYSSVSIKAIVSQ